MQVCIAGLALLFLFIGLRSLILSYEIYKGPIASIGILLPISTARIEGIQRVSYRKTVQVAKIYEQIGGIDPYNQARYWLAFMALSGQLSKELDINITDEEIDAWIENDGGDLAGISEGDTKKYIVKTYLEMVAITQISKEKGLYQDESWSRIIGVETFVEMGIHFADLASLYSEIPSANQGGSIGMVTIDDAPDLYITLFSSEEPFVILEDNKAYYLIKIHERGFDIDDIQYIKVSEIGIYKTGIEGIMQSYAKQYPVLFY